MPIPASTCLLKADHFSLASTTLSFTAGDGSEETRKRRNSRSSRTSASKPSTLYRLVVMGSSRVGKTALINQFLYDKFVADHKPTVEELHRGEYDASGETVVLDILDTSGTYSFPAMRALSIEKADGFVLVYAVDDVQSFEEVRALRDQIIEGRRQRMIDATLDHSSSCCLPAPAIVVVANKGDLREDKQHDMNDFVHRETAETTVCIDWEHAFVESSAKHHSNVDRIFNELLSRIDNVRFSKSDLGRRYSCPPTVQRTSDVSQSGGRVKHLLKRHSCSIS